MGKAPKQRFYELNCTIPKLQLLEIFPLQPFLENHDRLTLIDVGANKGLWSEAFLKTHHAALDAMIMLEPMPELAARLRRRDQLIFRPMCKGTEIIEAAAGPQAGEVMLHYDAEESLLASAAHQGGAYGNRHVILSKSRAVPMVTIDAVIAERALRAVHVMKIDVEGFERQVMEGAAASMRAGLIRNILFEYGENQARIGQTFEMLHRYLTGFGYTVYKPQRGINFFGLAPVLDYKPKHEAALASVEMVLATLDTPSPTYSGDRVIGRPL